MGNPPGNDDDKRLEFDQVHRKYHAKIYNLILRLVGDKDDADDLTVETFLNAYRAWNKFRGDARVSTWLHQIAVNNCKNKFKQNDRRREREYGSLDDTRETEDGELGREVADWSEAPERILLNEELKQKLQDAINALRSEYKVVLVLCEMEDKSYDEIAEITGLSVPAVKTRLHRARGMLRQRLEHYYRDGGGKR